jgi:hypothetical protein
MSQEKKSRFFCEERTIIALPVDGPYIELFFAPPLHIKPK